MRFNLLASLLLCVAVSFASYAQQAEPSLGLEVASKTERRPELVTASAAAFDAKTPAAP